MDRPPGHARMERTPKSYTLRSPRSAPGVAAWGGLPERDRSLLRWLLVGDLVTSELAAVLVYGSLRTARRRLARMVELGLLRGFWAANSQRPRGRYAYALTVPARRDLERAVGGEPARARRPGPGTSTIHQLATNDLLVAFLRGADPSHGLGLQGWLSERMAAPLFDDYVKPAAIAIIAAPSGSICLIVERDLGTETTSLVAAKMARYTTIFAGRGHVSANVAIVAESGSRAASIRRAISSAGASGVHPWTTTAAELETTPYFAQWSSPDGRRLPTVSLPAADGGGATVAGALCLLDPDAFEVFERSALLAHPAVAPFARLR